jgi:hypothetical protein
MTALLNLITDINNYWTYLVIVIALVVLGTQEIKKYKNLSTQEKIDAALAVVKKEVLKMMSKAEIDWEEYKKSGELKKSQVITDIYTQFPILSEYVNQDELIEKIEALIEEEMGKMNQIINEESSEETYVTESE